MTNGFAPPTASELVLVTGLSSDDLRTFIEAEQAHWTRYGGMPILPSGYEVTIVYLTPDRFEPNIEDTP